MELNYQYTSNLQYPVRTIRRRSYNQESARNLNRGFATKGVSAATQRKIAMHCRGLALAAEPQRVRNSRGEYVQHLITFVTLTIPATQQHTDQYFTSTIFALFLQKCRNMGMLRNYVWRAEKQKNGNIHYHLLTDTFAPFSVFRRLWYATLYRYGYMTRYAEKFSRMSLQEYAAEPFNKNLPIAKIAESYAKGRRCGWSMPPCVRVDFESSPESLNRYLSKYVGKPESGIDNIVEGRVWAASAAVRAVTDQLRHDQNFNEFWYNAGVQILKKREYVQDFFSICKCRISSIFAWFPDTLEYVRNMIRMIFQPCTYYRRSLGLTPV